MGRAVAVIRRFATLKEDGYTRPDLFAPVDPTPRKRP